MSLLILVFFLFILYFSANAERKIAKEKNDNITKHHSFVLTQLAYYSTLAVPEYSNHFVCKGYQKPHNNILPRHKHEI